MAYVLIGLVAGLCGGLLGIGGSIVIIPALTELDGVQQHLYQAAAMIVNFFVVVPAAFQHARSGTIHGPTVARLIPAGIVGVIAGVALSELPWFAGTGESYLVGLFVLFMLYSAVYDVAGSFGRAKKESEPHTAATLPWPSAVFVGGTSGLVGGLLGVGGGLIAVPLQRRFFRIPMRTAIANSAATIIGQSFVGAIVKNYSIACDGQYTMRQSLTLAAMLVPGAVLGSVVGARLMHRLPVRLLHAAFAILLVVAAVRLGIHAIRTPDAQSGA